MLDADLERLKRAPKTGSTLSVYSLLPRVATTKLLYEMIRVHSTDHLLAHETVAGDNALCPNNAWRTRARIRRRATADHLERR